MSDEYVVQEKSRNKVYMESCVKEYWSSLKRRMGSLVRCINPCCVGLSLILLPAHSIFARVVTYDHKAEKSDATSFDVPTQAGNSITLNVLNTCDSSKILASGIKLSKEPVNSSVPRPSASQVVQPVAGDHCAEIRMEKKTKEDDLKSKTCFLSSKTIDITHKSEFDGYLVKVLLSDSQNKRNAVSKEEFDDTSKRAQSKADEVCEVVKSIADTAARDAILKSAKSELSRLYQGLEKTELKSTELIINVQTEGWLADFSGGVIVSDLTDPVYGLRTSDNITTISRLKSSEDEHSLVLGAFTHVYHSAWRNRFLKQGTPAITAGLSVNNGSTLDYFVGPSIKFGSAFVNMGFHWGQVSRLPTAFFEGQEVVEDADTLNAVSSSNLESKTKRGIYFSLSYTFAGQGKSTLVNRLALPTTTVSE